MILRRQVSGERRKEGENTHVGHGMESRTLETVFPVGS